MRDQIQLKITEEEAEVLLHALRVLQDNFLNPNEYPEIQVQYPDVFAKILESQKLANSVETKIQDELYGLQVH